MKENRFVRVLSAMLFALAISHVITDVLLHFLPGVFTCMLMIPLCMYGGAGVAYMLASAHNESRVSYRKVHSLVMTLVMLAGIWERYGKSVERIDPESVQSQVMLVIVIAIVIGYFNEYGTDISSFFVRRFQKSKTAP